MRPSEQERRCAAAICEYLRRTTYGDWQVMAWLDAQHDNEPNPDVLVSDGRECVAIEIKQLTDGDNFQTHGEVLLSLSRKLAPDSTRSYALVPPPLTRLPLKRGWVKRIKSAIATGARELQVGEAVDIPILRRATVKFFPRSDVGAVLCQHTGGDEVRGVSPKVKGLFLLEDYGEPDHQFLSEERRTAFQRKLSQACRTSKRDGQAEVEWYEEWTLWRDEDSVDGKGGVLVITAVADFLESAAIRSLKKAIQAARQKFATKKWAGRTAVALHAGEQQHVLSLDFFATAIAGLQAADVQPLDSAFLVTGTHVRQFNFTS